MVKRRQCGCCNASISVKDLSLQCFLCSNWFHQGCLKIKTSLYHALKEAGHDFIQLNCDKCRATVKRTSPTSETTTKANESFTIDSDITIRCTADTVPQQETVPESPGKPLWCDVVAHHAAPKTQATSTPKQS